MSARKGARKSAKKSGKKSPKQSASKKKPKKKPKRKPKKKPSKPPASAPKPQEFIIRLMSNDQGVDSQPRPSRKRRDLVNWVNESTVERRLTFDGGVWPFEGAPCAIVVPLDGETGWYRVEKRSGETGVVAYSYTSDPPFAPGAPPGDPVMDTGD